MIRRSSFSDDQRVLTTNYQESEVLDNTYGNEDQHYHQSSNLPSLPSLPSIDDTESVNSVSPTDINKFQTSGPLDRFNFNFIGFYLLGIVTMVPWNFFITAEDVSCFSYHSLISFFVSLPFVIIMWNGITNFSLLTFSR